MEERQGVRLRQLREVHQPPQLGRRRRNPNAQQLVAGLGRGHQVADGTDAARAGRQGRHLAIGPSFAELLEAAELRQVELGIVHLARVVQLQRDPRVTFDARHRFDGNGSTHRLVPCGLRPITHQIVSLGWDRVSDLQSAHSARARSRRPAADSPARTDRR